jgi:hypothetical protein
MLERQWPTGPSLFQFTLSSRSFRRTSRSFRALSRWPRLASSWRAARGSQARRGAAQRPARAPCSTSQAQRRPRARRQRVRGAPLARLAVVPASRGRAARGRQRPTPEPLVHHGDDHDPACDRRQDVLNERRRQHLAAGDPGSPVHAEAPCDDRCACHHPS